MNIIHFTTHLNAGGITSYLYTLGRGLVARGHKVFIVSSGGDSEQRFEGIGVKLLNLNIRTKSELSPKLYLAIGIIRQYIAANQVSIIHSHTRICQVMGAILKQQCQLSYLSTCHGFFKTRLSRRLFPCWGDKVIAISGPVADHLRNDFSVKQCRIELIPTGIDLNVYTQSESINIKKLRLYFGVDASREFVVGNVARLSDVKGPDILIKAMPQIRESFSNVVLLLVGQGRMEQELRSLVVSMGLQDCVIFSSVCGNTAEILPVFDVFVMPSRQEGLGLSVMEAQASGLAVVASRVGGIPSIVEHEQTGLLVDVQNVEQVAQAVIRLLKDRHFAKSLGCKARLSAVKYYSAESMVDKMVNVYESLERIRYENFSG